MWLTTTDRTASAGRIGIRFPRSPHVSQRFSHFSALLAVKQLLAHIAWSASQRVDFQVGSGSELGYVATVGPSALISWKGQFDQSSLKSWPGVPAHPSIYPIVA